MSYLYADFVTRLPIQPNQKIVLFFINEPISKKFVQNKTDNNAISVLIG